MQQNEFFIPQWFIPVTGMLQKKQHARHDGNGDYYTKLL
jgi:hypothetical protein